MKAVVISCANCSRSWKLHQADPVYLQFDLSTRPCPHCEAYTLSCQGSAEPARDRRPRRARGFFPKLAPAPGV